MLLSPGTALSRVPEGRSGLGGKPAVYMHSSLHVQCSIQPPTPQASLAHFSSCLFSRPFYLHMESLGENQASVAVPADGLSVTEGIHIGVSQGPIYHVLIFILSQLSWFSGKGLWRHK